MINKPLSMKKYIGFIFFIVAIIIFPKGSVFARNAFIVSELAQGINSSVGIFDDSGKLLNTIGNIGFSGGINFACGDVDGDNEDELVIVARYGQPRVKIFSRDGKIKHSEFLTHGKNYYGGLDVALGDLNSDNKDEIIVSSSRGSTQIKVFDYEGNELNSGFYAFSEFFHGGVRIASGDVDLDGRDDIIAGLGKGGVSEVRIFDISGNLKTYRFFPFSRDYLGGVDVAAGDVEGDGKDEIITCQLNNGNWCKIYHYNSIREIINEWSASKTKTGINVSAADMNKNGKDEIVTSTNIYNNIYIKSFEREDKMKEVLNFNFPGSIYGGNSIGVMADSERDKAKVIYVDDGDTIFLDDDREIRYIGIDTPEIEDDYYFKATNRNQELVYEREVELEYDKQKLDSYGRTLAYVYMDDEFINAKLLEEGHARLKTFPPNVKYLELFKEKEETAKNNNVGVWQDEEKGKSDNGLLNMIGGFLRILF